MMKYQIYNHETHEVHEERQFVSKKFSSVSFVFQDFLVSCG